MGEELPTKVILKIKVTESPKSILPMSLVTSLILNYSTEKKKKFNYHYSERLREKVAGIPGSDHSHKTLQSKTKSNIDITLHFLRKKYQKVTVVHFR